MLFIDTKVTTNMSGDRKVVERVNLSNVISCSSFGEFDLVLKTVDGKSYLLEGEESEKALAIIEAYSK